MQAEKCRTANRYSTKCAGRKPFGFLPAVVVKRKIKPKPDYPLKTLYPRAFQTGQTHLIYYDFTPVE